LQKHSFFAAQTRVTVMRKI